VGRVAWGLPKVFWFILGQEKPDKNFYLPLQTEVVQVYELSGSHINKKPPENYVFVQKKGLRRYEFGSSHIKQKLSTKFL